MVNILWWTGLVFQQDVQILIIINNIMAGIALLVQADARVVKTEAEDKQNRVLTGIHVQCAAVIITVAHTHYIGLET